jgi:hypothetical protein
MARRLSGLIAIAWAGVLWTTCAFTAPGLFAIVADRSAAGRIAGAFFERATWVGLVASLLLVAGLMVGGHPASNQHRLLGWIATAALAPAASQWLLVPMMDAARLSGDASRFAMLHGFAGGLFVLASVALLIVVLRLTRPAI